VEGISLAVCAICCLAAAANRTRPEVLIAVVALYATLHFSYTLPALLHGPGLGGWVEMLGGFAAARLAGAVFVCVIFIVLCVDTGRDRNLVLVVPFAAAAALAAAGFAIERCCGAVRWQDLASVCGFFIFAGLLFAFLARRPHIEVAGFARRWIPLVGGLVLASAAIGIYEVVYSLGWANFRLSTGEVVVRASSLFFNPNWYGAWLALVALALTLTADSFAERAPAAGVTAVLVGAGFFLSGSRGMLLLFLISWAVFTALRPAPRGPSLRIGVAVLTGLTACVASLLLVHAILQPSPASPIPPLTVLAFRWSFFPLELLAYANLRMHSLLPPLSLPGLTLSSEFAQSVEGRFAGDLRDNGFLAVYDEAGVVALTVLVAACSVLTMAAVNALRRLQTRFAGAAALSLCAATVLLAVQMRAFQVFPAWLVAAAAFAVSARMLLPATLAGPFDQGNTGNSGSILRIARCWTSRR
jgi:hypothetical protein